LSAHTSSQCTRVLLASFSSHRPDARLVQCRMMHRLTWSTCHSIVHGTSTHHLICTNSIDCAGNASDNSASIVDSILFGHRLPVRMFWVYCNANRPTVARCAVHVLPIETFADPQSCSETKPTCLVFGRLRWECMAILPHCFPLRCTCLDGIA
jgi:hypothetical protein